MTGCDEARRRDAVILSERIQRVTITPECSEENRQKQATYEEQRRKWRDEPGRAD